MQYYFLGTLLPPLKYGEENEFSFQDFKDLLNLNLVPKDREKFEVLLRFYDWVNLRAFWKDQPLGLIGTWEEHQFDKLAADEEIPEYLRVFLENYPHKEDQISKFPELLMRYYQESTKGGFLAWWLKFEGGLRLNMAAVRAVARNKDLENEIVFHNTDDEEIADIKAEVEGHDFSPKEPYQALMEIYKSNQRNPLELDQSLDRFRFKAIEEWMAFDHFSINYILAYTVLYFMNLKFTLRSEKGAKTIVEHYLKEVF